MTEEQHFEPPSDETLRRLAKAIENLPLLTRTVFKLHRFDGLDYKQIEQRVGLSAAAVEKHMAKGICQIARDMEPRRPFFQFRWARQQKADDY